MNHMIAGALGVIIAADTLQTAIRTWGPKPFHANIQAVYIVDGEENPAALKEIQKYFGTKVFTVLAAFCRPLASGFILHIAANPKTTAALTRLNKTGVVVDGAAALLLWEFIDRAEKKTLERELFYQALNSTVEGIEIANSQGMITFINTSMLTMINVPEQERLGQSVYSVSPDGGMARVLEQKQAVKNLRNCPQGTKVEVMSNAGPIYINGNFYGAVTVANDVTELRQLSKALEENKRISAMLEKKLGCLAATKYTFDNIIGKNRQLLEIIHVARRAAAGELSILIQGESGTGKEIFAHAIHNCSARSSKPFIPVNCAAIPEQLLESEFFGHEKGAFTSAVARKPGLFDLANTGTLFLDEIGDMNLNLQSKLLRVLQDKVYMRVGGTKAIQADVRIIAATNRNLTALVAEGKFREDLFYRLSVINIAIPPLRERIDDLEDISEYLLRRIAAREGIEAPQLGPDAVNRLAEYPWPGNIRELENVLERAAFLCQGKVIRGRDIHLPEIYLKKNLHATNEKTRIIECLQACGSTVDGKREAARRLDISLATLYNKIKLYRLSDFYSHVSRMQG
jgi:Transcriptional regulator containing PAS, AAA-type ATPase, and DNA-binding domains